MISILQHFLFGFDGINLRAETLPLYSTASASLNQYILMKLIVMVKYLHTYVGIFKAKPNTQPPTKHYPPFCVDGQ